MIDELKRFKEFLIKKEYSNQTVNNYYWGVKGFLEYINTNNLNLEIINEEDIINYKSKLIEKNFSKASINSKMHAIVNFIKFKRSNIEINISKVLERTRKKDARIISSSEFEKLTSTPDIKTMIGLRDALIIKLLYYTGIKIQDLPKILRKNIKTDIIELRGRQILLPKPISDEIQKFLRNRGDSHPALFINYSSAKRIKDSNSQGLSIRSIENIFNRYKSVVNDRLTIYDLRNSYVANLINVNFPIEKIHEHDEISIRNDSDFFEILK